MPATRYDFSIEQGSSYQIVFVYKDEDKKPIDLEGWCARLSWTTDKGMTQKFSSDNIDDLSYDMKINENPGEIKILLPADTTDSFDFITAKYDLDLQSNVDFTTAGDKYVIRIIYGEITLILRNSDTTTNDIC